MMIDLVCVNYRTPHDLDGFMEAWAAQRNPKQNLVISNVSPTKDDTLVAERWKEEFPEITVLSYEENVGYSGACNDAAFKTNNEAICFLNADTRLGLTTVDDCLEVLFSEDNIGVVGPLQVDEKGRINSAGIVGKNRFPHQRGWMSKHTHLYEDKVEDVVSVLGSAYFVKRKCWDDLTWDKQWRSLFPHINGAFLPTKHYYEETWFSYFARHKGWRVVFVGTTKMIHKWHQASPVQDKNDRDVISESRVLFRSTCDYFGIERD